MGPVIFQPRRLRERKELPGALEELAFQIVLGGVNTYHCLYPVITNLRIMYVVKVMAGRTLFVQSIHRCIDESPITHCMYIV